MKVISVNVGLPREVAWNGGRVTTGIFKSPVSGSVPVRRLNLDGTVRGIHRSWRFHKAVYAYPIEHYPKWRDELPELELPRRIRRKLDR
jgi:MOSC domain-containing protein YiiM